MADFIWKCLVLLLLTVIAVGVASLAAPKKPSERKPPGAKRLDLIA
ncbi:hypothetical protein [Methylobacterium sp. 1030]